MKLLAEQSTDELLSQFRIGLGKVGLWAFHKVYAEYDAVDMGYVDGGQWMWDICAWLDEAVKPGGYIVGAVPRNHMKTALGTTSNGARVCCYRLKRNIVVIGKNKDEATNKMRNIVDGFLERNPLIQRDFGNAVSPAIDAQGKHVTYNNKEIILTNGCRMAAMQLCGPIRGQNKDNRRVDMVIFDDPEDDKTVLNSKLRDEQYDWLKSACFNSMHSDQGSLIWLGTILHDDSVLNRQIRDIHTRLKFKLPAYNLKTLEPLWPEYWTFEKLMERKAIIKARMFSQEFLNTPIAEEDQAYKPSYWKFYDRASIVEMDGRFCIPNPDYLDELVPLNIIMAVDPAISQKKDADWFAYMVMGYMVGTPYKFILEIFRGKLSFGNQVNKIKSAAHRWKVIKAVIEAQQYQEVLSQATWDVGVPSEPKRHWTGKEARNRGAAIYYERGEVYLPRNEEMTDEFCNECEVFPSGEHDDMLDTSTMCLEEIVHNTGSERVYLTDRRRNMHLLSRGFVGGNEKITSGF